MSDVADRRLISIDTHLGSGRPYIVELVGDETISNGFLFEATLYSDDLAIEPRSMVGRAATIWLRYGLAAPEPINGVINQFTVGTVNARGLREYRAQIVSWFWLLTCTADSRIFQNLTFPEIIEKVFGEYGLKDFETRLIERYDRLDYCVQYRESTHAFLSRWMEKLGICYFFRHEPGRHVMVIADNNLAFRFVTERDVTFNANETNTVAHWRLSERFRPGRHAQSDFAFKTPSLDLLTRESTIYDQPRAKDFEIFDFPAGYTTLDYGRFLTRTRMEEDEARIHSVEGASSHATFRAGGKVTTANHPMEAERSQEYILVRVAHRCRDMEGYSGVGELPSYANTFVAVPAKPPWRPERVTPWPIVHGPQTARVVGLKGELIHTEKHGRVKLLFHWDRRGKGDETSSCWVRVSQNTAGPGWGGVFIPHIGHEVVVSFLDGDPDRPLVTGRVYNGENMQAIGLPGDKTQSAIRDHSGNEIVMEGKKGREDVRIHATKDTNVTVTHDYNETVKTGNRTIAIQAGSHTETIHKDTKITVTTGAYAHSVAANTASRTSKNKSTLQSTSADILVDAATEITIHVGASMIVMKSDGSISIQGKNIAINGSESVSISGGAVRSHADQEHEIKGSIVLSDGSATNTVKGGMVMLNP